MLVIECSRSVLRFQNFLLDFLERHLNVIFSICLRLKNVKRFFPPWLESSIILNKKEPRRMDRIPSFDETVIREKWPFHDVRSVPKIRTFCVKFHLALLLRIFDAAKSEFSDKTAFQVRNFSDFSKVKNPFCETETELKRLLTSWTANYYWSLWRARQPWELWPIFVFVARLPSDTLKSSWSQWNVNFKIILI